MTKEQIRKKLKICINAEKAIQEEMKKTVKDYLAETKNIQVEGDDFEYRKVIREEFNLVY